MPARTDNVPDPEIAAALVLMRHGQAYWARAMGDLRDDELGQPSLVPGWSRRHVMAHIGLHARTLARLVAGAGAGAGAGNSIAAPMDEADSRFVEQLALGATLPPDALRHLCEHASVHLNVEWRDLPATAWARRVRMHDGRAVLVSETVWLRTREVWLRAVDLRAGTSVHDFPGRLIDLLLDDLIAVWRCRRRAGDRQIVLEPTDRDARYRILAEGAPDPLVVRGTAADLVGWGTGRTTRGVVTSTGTPPCPAPPWM